MNKQDLKQLIKPLVKECIHEVLLEEGLLANVVSEVARGMQSNVVLENTAAPQKPQVTENVKAQALETRQKLNNHRQSLMDSIGSEAYNGVNLFEGTAPMKAQTAAPKAGSVDIGEPSDSGVDISSLMGGAARMWNAMK